MHKEAIIFRSPDGEETRGEAEVLRWSPTMLGVQATMWAVGGLVLGTACILIPVVHLVTTWALPLLGIVMAVRTMKRTTHVVQPAGRCPNCDEPITLAGGGIDDAMWQVCPNCRAQLTVRPESEENAAADRKPR